MLRDDCENRRKRIEMDKSVYFFDVDTIEDYHFLLNNGPFL
ncbi:hypothetical protein QNH20_11095 [Neobacillus sp. WH10]|nr:hypothetical protein [Neobacillus sp. WH10]WHY79647.1 hypothetical protein QNH20_11095 [Neobacillus sp. WH10]